MFEKGKTESELYISLLYTLSYAPGPLIALLLRKTSHRTVLIIGEIRQMLLIIIVLYRIV